MSHFTNRSSESKPSKVGPESGFTHLKIESSSLNNVADGNLVKQLDNFHDPRGSRAQRQTIASRFAQTVGNRRAIQQLGLDKNQSSPSTSLVQRKEADKSDLIPHCGMDAEIAPRTTLPPRTNVNT